jgi:hypothetical protein
VKFGSAARKAIEPTGDLIARAAAADRFKGKNGSSLDIVAPPGLDAARLVIVGVGKARDLKAQDFVKLGGMAMGKIRAAASSPSASPTSRSGWSCAPMPSSATRPSARTARRRRRRSRSRSRPGASRPSRRHSHPAMRWQAE